MTAIFNSRRMAGLFACLMAAVCLLSAPVSAADDAVHCFSQADFSGSVTLDGIVITEVPANT